MFFSNHFNQTISLVIVEPTMYSNSIMLLAMHGCFQLTHVTRPPFTKRKTQVCDLQSSMLPYNSPNHNMLTRCEGDYQHWTLWQSLVTTSSVSWFLKQCCKEFAWVSCCILLWYPSHMKGWAWCQKRKKINTQQFHYMENSKPSFDLDESHPLGKHSNFFGIMITWAST
jgi:hypothetical protein